MTLIIGILYIIYLLLLGSAMRLAVSIYTKDKAHIKINMDFITHAFFQGVMLLILLLNFLQYLPVTAITVTTILAAVGTLSLLVVLIGIKHMTSQVSYPDKSGVTLTLLVLICSTWIYISGIKLPNIAWDSWTVWEGKANQWINHGLSSQIESWNHWVISSDSLYNQSANYPDGLSLLFFTPKLVTNAAFYKIHLLYLFAFAASILVLIKHIKALGAPFFLQVLFILVIYTTPLLINHLIIIGYADIWIGMILTLVVIAYLDYYSLKTKDNLFTLIAYLALLPMFKLEGWVWLFLFILSHILVQIYSNIKVRTWLIGLLAIFLIWTLSVGISLNTPMGELILNNKQVIVFGLIDTKIAFNNVTDLLMSSLFWQNNWSLIWLGLPFLLASFIKNKHNKPNRVTQVFFSLSILSFLFLFYFTEASQWAEDFTAINRIVLQLTPAYLFLLFKMLTEFQNDIKVRHQHSLKEELAS